MKNPTSVVRLPSSVVLTHNQFPNTEERDGHDEGWDNYFLGPMKEWLEGKN